MRIIKVGTQYLGLVDDQRSAIRFTGGRDETRIIASAIASNTGDTAASARAVKLTTRADRAGASMRGLADDVNEGDR